MKPLKGPVNEIISPVHTDLPWQTTHVSPWVPKGCPHQLERGFASTLRSSKYLPVVLEGVVERCYPLSPPDILPFNQRLEEFYD